MRALDVEGLFWLDADPNDKLYGHLTFEPQAGGQLELNGSLKGLQEFIPIQIQGKTQMGDLTLVGCTRLSLSEWMANISLTREVYHVEFIFEGVCFSPDQKREFSAAHFELRYLDRWIWKPGASVKLDYREDADSKTGIVITGSTPPKEVVQMNDGDLELLFGYKLRSSHPMGETAISEYVGMGFRFSEPKSLRVILSVCRALQNLLTIGLNEPSAVEAFSLICPTANHNPQSTPPVQHSITLYTQLQGDLAPREEKPIHPLDMLFTFDNIDGLDGVAKWLRISDKFDMVIGLLIGHLYLPITYEENRLLNTLIATEALIRIRTGKQRFNFKTGLIDMVNHVGVIFRSLVGDSGNWAENVVKSRTMHLVHPGLHGRLSAWEMDRLSGSLYFLVVLCLLREADVPEATLSKIAQNKSFMNLAAEFRNR